MKKLVLFAAVAVVVSFASCKKTAQQEALPQEEVEAVVEPTEEAEGAVVLEAEEAAPAEEVAE